MRFFAQVCAVAAMIGLSAAPLRAEGDKDIVSVNGIIIRQSEVMERLWKRFGPATLDEMVDEILLRQEAKAKGIKAEPADVGARLNHYMSQFSSPTIFESQLQQTGSSLEKFKEDIAEQLVIRKLIISGHKLAVKDEELKAYFQANKNKMGAPPAAHLKHILVKTETEAVEIVGLVKKGSDFSQLAKERSLAPTGKLTGGDYGFVSRGMLPKEIEDIAFAMKPAEMRIMPSAKGFHILQVLTLKPGKPAEFAAVKDELRDILMDEKIKQVVPAYIQEIRKNADIKPLGNVY